MASSMFYHVKQKCIPGFTTDKEEVLLYYADGSHSVQAAGFTTKTGRPPHYDDVLLGTFPRIAG